MLFYFLESTLRALALAAYIPTPIMLKKHSEFGETEHGDGGKRGHSSFEVRFSRFNGLRAPWKRCDLHFPQNTIVFSRGLGQIQYHSWFEPFIRRSDNLTDHNYYTYRYDIQRFLSPNRTRVINNCSFKYRAKW